MRIEIFPTSKYKEEYADLAEERRKLKEKPKARRKPEDFSLIFDKACKAVSGPHTILGPEAFRHVINEEDKS